MDFFKFFETNGGDYLIDQVTLANNQMRAENWNCLERSFLYQFQNQSRKRGIAMLVYTTRKSIYLLDFRAAFPFQRGGCFRTGTDNH